MHGEASGKKLYLDCLPPMKIVQAIYGANCRHNDKKGLVTSSVAQSSRRLGDPARVCDKDFRVFW